MTIGHKIIDNKRRVQLSTLLLLVCSSASMAANIIRGPYVQMGTDNSMIVRWDTDTATSSQVKFGSSATSLNQTKTESSSTTQHIVTLTGLSPLTKYYYSVGSSSQVLAGQNNSTFFKTSPRPGDSSPTRIWVVGDPGVAGDRPGTLDQQYVLDGYKAYNNGQYTDFWLMLGDNAYNDGTIQEYQNAVFDQYPDLLKQSPLWPSMGNHDNRSADVDTQSGGFYDLFSLPTNGEAGGESSDHEAYYSFDYGNVHVVVLNSADSEHNQLSGPMDEWLEADLRNTQAEWIIATFHHAPYGVGHDSDTESGLIRMRENFLPILESHGVDLVMAGHNHYYSRSSFIKNHYGNSSTYSNSSHSLNTGDGRIDGDGAYTKIAGAPSSGTVYITHGAGSGGGTSSARKVTQSDIDSGDNHTSDYYTGGRGSIVIDIEGDSMTVNVINQAGDVNDHFTIKHSNGGSSPTNRAPDAVIDGPYEGETGTSIEMRSSGSTDPDGDPIQYLWDFGDNKTSPEANPSHTYDSADTYTVTLTVSDGSLSDVVVTEAVITSAPVVSSVLQNGVSKTVTGSSGEEVHFTMEVPADATNLVFEINGGTGDADLYVLFDDVPSSNDKDCFLNVPGNNETCVISNNEINQGTYYVMLRGYSSFNNVSLTGSFSTDGGGTEPDTDPDPESDVLTNGVELNITGTASSESHFTFNLPAGISNLTVAISGGTGDADLYVNYGAVPTSGSGNDCFLNRSGNSETCDQLDETQVGTWYVRVNGYSSYENVTLLANWDEGTDPGTEPDTDPNTDNGVSDACENSTPVTEGDLTAGEVTCLGDANTLFFAIGNVKNHNSIAITTGNGTGDLSMLYKTGGWPSVADNHGSSDGTGNNECIYLTNLSASSWGYIEIKGNASGASIIVDFDTPACR